MKTEAKVGGRRVKSDPRDLRNWCGSLTMRASSEGDQFILAAIYRALSGVGDQNLVEALRVSAQECLKEHLKQEKRTGVKAVIS